MAIDINQLSSDELFELATKRKRQEEERAAARRIAVAELKKRKDELVAEHAHALESIDNSIRELHNQRAHLVIRHKTAVDAVDRELAERRRETRRAAPSAGAQPQLSVVQQAVPTKTQGGDFAAAVLDLLKGRADISESLLKEKLRARGFTVTNLDKQLEPLLKQGKIASRGHGNYSSCRKRG
jgi:hypothetical protein